MGVGENIFIHLGQAGVQTGLACWELFCLEHGLYPDGRLATEFGHGPNEGELSPFFMETTPCRYVPRALLFDFDAEVIRDIRNGSYRELFSLNNLVSGKEDSANNYARGYYSLGREFIDCAMDKLRHIAEATDSFQGFFMFRSTGGGSGSGFGSLMLQRMSDDYGSKVARITFEVSPSTRISTAAVEPLNAVLAYHSSVDQTELTFLYENEMMYEIIERALGIKCSAYNNINHLMAQVVSGITASFRFDGSLNTDITELRTNLVPFPRVHYPLLSYSPMIAYDRTYHERHTVNSLANDVFSPTNLMAKCDPRKGKYMAACLLFRGDVTPNDVNMVIQKLRKNKSKSNRMKFADWSPGGFKIGLCSRYPLAVPGSSIASGCRAVAGMLNTTAVASSFETLLHKFDILHVRKAFMHWYLAEGMEAEEFQEARNNLDTLVQEFHEIERPLPTPG